MNPTGPVVPSAPRRRWGTWLLVAIGLCLTPFVILGAVALSYITLNRDVRTLRNQVMAATSAEWNTKVQVNIGAVTLGAVRLGLQCVDGREEIETARDALRAVKHASVGVYERQAGKVSLDRSRLFLETDRAMQRRGWTRLIGVIDTKEAVLIYTQPDSGEAEPIELCVAVVNEKELVVAATTVDAQALGDLVARHAGSDIKKHIRFAQFRY
jgi:hypothetical protein